MTLENKILDTISFDIYPIDKSLPTKLIGYNLESTATIHVEDKNDFESSEREKESNRIKEELNKIASHLIDSGEAQLTIAVHGYSNTKYDAQERYKNIYKYAENICHENAAFVGYRWPAENPVKDDNQKDNSKVKSFFNKTKLALQTLPSVLLGTLISSLALGIMTIFTLLVKPTTSNLLGNFSLVLLVSALLSSLLIKIGDAKGFIPFIPNGLVLVFFALLITGIGTDKLPIPVNSESLLVILLVLFVLIFGAVLALILIRLSTYQSDRYRASNYGVIDLVEFIRQLDQALLEKACEQAQIPEEEWSDIRNFEDKQINKGRVKLSFISHSLGCEVVTQTIRILTDVFDPYLIKTSEVNLTGKVPYSKIGRVFSLGRLILVAPDVPVESILSGRANFLRSSLRRCEEAYVFSNEADLALRIASTAANYFSFPAKTRFRGYKLGNITAKNFIDKSDNRKGNIVDPQYGIINLDNPKDNPPHKNIEVRVSNLEHRTLNELVNSEEKESEKNLLEEKAIADFFTYFDCTDYIDFKGNPTEADSEDQKEEGVLCVASGKYALNLWWDYIALCFAYFFSMPRSIDVHGGYFNGKFSQKLIYDLAFLGFNGFLSQNYNDSLSDLSKHCQEKGIRVVLASKDLPHKPS
jgi:hypothetical protein